MVKAYDIKDEDLKDIVFLIVAHEMVHMLDDQYFDLYKTQNSMDNSEALNAFAALREGDAVYVTDQIAERLKVSENVKEIGTKSASGHSGHNKRAQMQNQYTIYIKGSEFVKAIIEKNGLQGVSEAFASPPVSTRQIMNPEEYFSPSSSVVFDCLRLLGNIMEELPTEGMQTQSAPLGAMALSAMLISQGISENEANSIANECLNGAVVIASKQTLKPKAVTVMAVNFSRRESAAQFLALSIKTDQSAEAQFNAKLNSSYTVVKEASLKLDGFDSARYRHVEKKTNDVVTTELSIEGFSDTFFVVVSFVNMQETITEEKISGIITTLGQERIKML